MKAIVAYDSVHGSTKLAAESIAEQIRAEGHEVQLVFVKEWSKAPLSGDLLFIGSPTRGGKPTKETEAFIESLDASYWKGKRVVTFTTVGPLSKDPEKRRKMLESMGEGSKSAATRMKEALERKGIQVQSVMHFAVVGMWGPLAPDGPQMAKELTHRFLSGL